MDQPYTGERCVPGKSLRETYEQHAARYRFALEWCIRGEDILDAGCGSGVGTALLSRKAGRVIAVDTAPSAVDFGRLRYGVAHTNIGFLRSSVQDLALPLACIDAAVAFEVLEHLPEPTRLLDEVRRVLRPGGRFIVSTPEWEAERYGSNPFHISVWSQSRLIQEISSRFTVDTEYFQGTFSHRELARRRWRSLLSHFARPARMAPGLRSGVRWLRKRRLADHVDLSPDEEYCPESPGVELWPIQPMSHLLPGQVPYIYIVTCHVPRS